VIFVITLFGLVFDAVARAANRIGGYCDLDLAIMAAW
jgi:hypothetical protein